MSSGQPSKRSAIVVAGAGARGAYEAAALAKVLPVLFPNGLGSTILLGTSAGAINVALLAARAANRDLQQVGDEIQAVWARIDRPDVFDIPGCTFIRGAGEATAEATRIGLSNAVGTLAAPPHWLAGKLPNAIANPLHAAIDLPGRVVNAIGGRFLDVVSFPVQGTLAAATALLDTAPLWETAETYVDFDAINRNIESGLLGGIGIVATSCPVNASGGRSCVFLKTRDGVVPKVEDGSSIDYAPTKKIDAAHVLASAAIPVAFPPIEITKPAPYAGWYTDGGVRLNAPLEPAIKLGARQILVVSSHAAAYPDRKALPRKPGPNLLDVAAQSIHAVLADGMIEDLRNLERVNTLVRAADPDRPPSTPSGRPYVEVDVRVVAPPNGTLSPLAAEAAELLTKRADIDGALLRLLQLLGESGGSNELLSYLLFDPEFSRRQFTVAERNAREAIKTWRGKPTFG